MRPSRISYHFTLVLLNKGSIKAVQKDAVAIPARQTDILDTLADQKNKIQCRAITNPVAKILKRSFRSSLTLVFRHRNISPKKREANKVLKKTVSKEGILINMPRMAVKLQITTIKWSIK